MPASGNDVLNTLYRAGWKKLRQKGSHVRVESPTGVRVTVPAGTKDLKRGTLKAIEEATGMSFE